MAQGSDERAAGFLAEALVDESPVGSAAEMFGDEAVGLAVAEEPFVSVGGPVGGQAIVGKAAPAAADRHPRHLPTVGQGHNDVAATNPEQFGEYGMEVVEVFEYIGADDAAEVGVVEGQAFDFFEVELHIGRAGDVDAGVGLVGQELFEHGLVAAHVEDGPLEIRSESLDEVGRAVTPLLEFNVVQRDSHIVIVPVRCGWGIRIPLARVHGSRRWWPGQRYLGRCAGN